MAEMSKEPKPTSFSGPRGCPSSKLFDNQREVCIEPKGHKPPHRDIFNRTWK
jgi:hypothetical protein